MEKINNFETVRDELRLDNRAFSKLLDIHETQYTKLKKGTYPVGAKTVNKIKDALPKYNLNWILNNELPKYNTEKKEDNSVVEELETLYIPKPNTIMKTNETHEIILNALTEKIKNLEEKLQEYEYRVKTKEAG